MLFTIREVVERLRLSQATVYSMCQRGLPAHERYGMGCGCIRVPEAALSSLRDVARAAGGGERKVFHDRSTA